jgi:hypothetical protein
MELLRLRSEVTHLRQATNVLATVAKSKTNNLPDADTIEIHLKARFISLPTEDLQALGTGSTGMQGGKTGLLTQKQFNRFHEELQGANDVEMISEPEVRFSNGQQTRMSAMQPVPVDGTNADIGTSLGATCYFSTNSSTFNLSLDAKLSELTGDPLKPDVQTIQATNQLTLFPGQTAFLEQQILPGGWLPDSTNSFAEARSLLVFITPTVVNARGNPINSPPSQ